MRLLSISLCSFILFIGCSERETHSSMSTKLTNSSQQFSLSKKDHQLRKVKKAAIAPELDGSTQDPAWKEVSWNNLDQRWLGEPYTSSDFTGTYKLTWTPEAIYILAEITDDTLIDKDPDPLQLWWDDDCLEIFIDADNSGGGHQFTHNAFAYHVALNGDVVDIAPGEIPTLYNNHVESKRVTIGNTTIWECKMMVYQDTYNDQGINEASKLEAGQKLGFALAYCDNDGSDQRENFIGSVPVDGEDKNRGWIDAGIFGTIELIE